MGGVFEEAATFHAKWLRVAWESQLADRAAGIEALKATAEALAPGAWGLAFKTKQEQIDGHGFEILKIKCW